jgi:hypothetical protein
MYSTLNFLVLQYTISQVGDIKAGDSSPIHCFFNALDISNWVVCEMILNVMINQVVREEDIREFFSGMEARKRQRATGPIPFMCK